MKNVFFKFLKISVFSASAEAGFQSMILVKLPCITSLVVLFQVTLFFASDGFFAGEFARRPVISSSRKGNNRT